MTAAPRSEPASAIPLRMARWRRSGNPTDLWPDVSEAALLAAHRSIWRTTLAVLRGRGGPAPLAGEGAGPARLLGIAAFRAGIGPLLGCWIEGGTVTADATVAAVLAEHLRQARRRAEIFESALADIAVALAARGITPTLLKGAQTAYTCFEEPACRVGADLDLLVPPAEFETACAVLHSLGFEERSRTRTPPRSVWYPRGAPAYPASLELTHADNPWSVDLHCSLERRYFRGLSATMDLATLERRPMTVAGREVMGLGDRHLAAFLALHGSRELAFPQAVRVVELVRVLRRASATPGFGHALHAYLAGQVLYRFVTPMLTLADEAAPGVLAGPIRQACGAAMTRRWRRWLDGLLANGLSRPHRRTVAERLVWADGTVDLLRIASDLVWHGEDLTFGDRVRLWREAAGALGPARTADTR